MSRGESLVGDIACGVLAVVFLLGFAVLAVRLKELQVDNPADYNLEKERQLVRRVQTAGARGRILDRGGNVLAENRTSFSIVLNAADFQRRSWSGTVSAITSAVARVSAAIGRPMTLTYEQTMRHVRQRLARPLVVWRDVGPREIAVICERADEFPGFSCEESMERVYPCGACAAHVIGYVGHAEARSDNGDERFSFRDRDLYGREGLERYYDEFLRGVPGETKLWVDARGFTMEEQTVSEPQAGLDLHLTLDVELQRVVEKELSGERGACVVMNPTNGEILAMASAPAFDLRDTLPFFPSNVYARLSTDPALPLFNRAANGGYAPGSTFKPITALAGLGAGLTPDAECFCDGVFALGAMRLHCARRWGHGKQDLYEALKNSCNPYFCALGYQTGTNAIQAAARAFGLGSRTGIDLGVDRAGVVPDAEWKQRVYGQPWRAGDLVQMSIGQGMLIVSPLQMARVVGAIGTGYLVRPHLKKDLPYERTPLPFPTNDLEAVRLGMYKVVNDSDGTGRNGGMDVPFKVCGKTGTAEVGSREHRRKNTWFIAFAPADNPRYAVALVVENGQSGGGTAAPKVADILKYAFQKEDRNSNGSGGGRDDG